MGGVTKVDLEVYLSSNEKQMGGKRWSLKICQMLNFLEQFFMLPSIARVNK